MSWMVDGVGRLLAHYLEKPVQGYEPFTPSDPDALRATLQPGDVLLVEGNNHISGVIKYLTQSTWSHAALYVGPIGGRATADGEPLVLVEANIGQGVVAAPLSKYARFHTRICRPTQLDDEDRARVYAYAAERIGFDYDLKNIVDLMRYLFPMPVPQRWRRRMMALGSGHPTRIICSALIARPSKPWVIRSYRRSRGSTAKLPGGKFWKYGIRRSTHHEISTFRPISKW